MHVVKGVDAVGIGAGFEAVVARTQFQRNIRQRLVGIIGQRKKRRLGAAQHSEDGSDALAVAHRAELREKRAGFTDWTRPAADGRKKTIVGALVREHDVLLAGLEAIAAVAILSAGEDVDFRGGFRRAGNGEALINPEMIARQARGDDVHGRGVLRRGFGCRAGRIGRMRRGVGDVFDRRHGAEENDVVLLQARALSGRRVRTSTRMRSERNGRDQKQKSCEGASNHRQYRTFFSARCEVGNADTAKRNSLPRLVRNPDLKRPFAETARRMRSRRGSQARFAFMLYSVSEVQ